MNIYLYLIGIVLLIALSAFFSASEMAFSSANKLRLEGMAADGSKRAAMASYICSRFDDALSTILIGNNLVNIAATSVATVIAILVAGEGYTAVATVIVTILIIMFGEVMPKIVAKKNANRLALSVAYVIRGLMFILRPVVFIVVWLVRLITHPMKGDAPSGGEEAVEELVSLIDTVEDEGVIDEERSELLHAALDFSEISASEAMTARVDIISIDIDDDWDEIMSVVDASPYSRIPVYEDGVDNIIGVLYTNRLFKAMIDNPRPDLRALLLDPCYVYKTIKLPDVLSQLRKHKVHLAVVTDEYGGSMGVISMEDVLEELVGEIWDETDEVSTEMIEHAPNLFEVDGDMSIYSLLEALERDENDFGTESSTVGGWTLERFGDYPEEGESFMFENLFIKVLKMDGMRVERILLHVKDDESE